MEIIADELDNYDIKRHKVVIDDNIEIEDGGVQEINCAIDKGFPPRNTLLNLYSSLNPFEDLLVSVFVFANDQCNILCN